MIRTRVFQNGNSQALRIPQELRTDEKEYCMSRIGKVYVAYPADDPWLPVRQVIGTFTDDYMERRDQPSWQEMTSREEF